MNHSDESNSRISQQDVVKNTDRPGRFLPRILPARQYLWAVVLFTTLGVVGGYTYYALVGCNTGSCAITSNPYMSMAWGGLLGYLMPDFFVKKEK